MQTFTEIEIALQHRGIRVFAGVDEAGRGPLAGPVAAAAVVFHPGTILPGVADSKRLAPAQRGALAERIFSCAAGVGIGLADASEIDTINILHASILAMHRAVEALPFPPEFLLVDGNRFHHPSLPFQTVVKGDAHCFSIAAASIIAKEHRDRLMEQLDALYPEYGFARHKGYPTKEHVGALRKYGPSPAHRRSFHVRELEAQQGIPFNV
jgi:ribonuclease HII